MPRTEINNNPSIATMESMGQNLEEKRAKREIANMNERRRMQNINAGFHSLRSLLPQKYDGEKLSKAAILQHTATYIYQLEQEITKLLSQNCELKSLAGGSTPATTNQTNTPDWVKRLQSQPPDCPSCKRRKYENNHRLDIDSSPINGDGSSTESSSEQEINSNNKYNRSRNKQNGGSARLLSDASALRKQLSRIEKELEDERRLRLMLEEELQYQGKTVNCSRQFHHPSSTIEHCQDEVEVASESLEIEMHSCPASPPEMVIASNENMNTSSSTALYPSTTVSHFQPQRIELGQNQQQRVQKQNAIALPIDVPFVAPREVDSPMESNNVKTNSNNGPVVVLVDSNVMLVESDGKIQAATTTSNPSSNAGHQTQILQLVPNNSSSKMGGPTILTAKHAIINNGGQIVTAIKNETTPDQAKTSRQNLNTIVEAIRHLEGDSLFNESTGKVMIKDEHGSTTEACMLKTTTNGNGGNVAAKKSIENSDTSSLSVKPKANIILSNISPNAKIVSVSGGQSNNTTNVRTYQTTMATDSSPRPQIIQIQRPNVIVANSVEN